MDPRMSLRQFPPLVNAPPPPPPPPPGMPRFPGYSAYFAHSYDSYLRHRLYGLPVYRPSRRIPPPPPPPPGDTNIKLEEQTQIKTVPNETEGEVAANESVNGFQGNGMPPTYSEQPQEGSAPTPTEEKAECVENESLPKDLTEKFHALLCDLCVVKMNSMVQARMHYNGKQHQKKVRMYLVNWAKENGQPVPKRMKKEEPATPKKVADPDNLYCKVCDLSFTSELHAQQHYMGRNHQRALKGDPPLKTGYFNKTTGKWQRYPPYDVPGRSGSRLGKTAAVPGDESVDATSSIGPVPAKKGRFYCELCKVGATSQEQLDMHFSGAKHRKATKTPGNKTTSTNTDFHFNVNKDIHPATTGAAANQGATDSILASVITAEEPSAAKQQQQQQQQGKLDFSIYRTPSGKYYCMPCNTTLNSESQFAQHTESKKHKIKVSTFKSK